MANSEKKPTMKKVAAGDVIFNILNYTVFLIYTILCIYPFYYLIINSISNNDMSANGLVNFIPHGIHLQNYKDVMKLKGIGSAMLVSVGRTVIGTVCTVLASAFMGFIFTQPKLWKKKLLYRFVVITMYFNAGLIPMFLTMKTFHLTNTFWVYIIPAIINPFDIIMMKTYLESSPRSLEEAAEVDGASILTIFTRVILPTSTPILATLAIWAAVGQWNAFQDTLLYVTDQNLYSLQYLLYTYINQANSLASVLKNSGNVMSIANLATRQTPTSIRMTVSVVVVLPILFIYPMFQKYFVKGIMIGAVKG